MKLVTDHTRDKNGRNVRPQSNACVDKGIERVSYGKAQTSVETSNKLKRNKHYH
jgi:hypothetical protein